MREPCGDSTLGTKCFGRIGSQKTARKHTKRNSLSGLLVLGSEKATKGVFRNHMLYEKAPSHEGSRRDLRARSTPCGRGVRHEQFTREVRE